GQQRQFPSPAVLSVIDAKKTLSPVQVLQLERSHLAGSHAQSGQTQADSKIAPPLCPAAIPTAQKQPQLFPAQMGGQVILNWAGNRGHSQAQRTGNPTLLQSKPQEAPY